MAKRVVFSTVRFPHEGKYNNGQNTRVYRGYEPVTDFYAPMFARTRCEHLAKDLAKATGGTASYTIPNWGDEVPQSDEGYTIVNPNCWVVEMPDYVQA